MPPRKRGWGRVVLARLPQEEQPCAILPLDNPSTCESTPSQILRYRSGQATEEKEKTLDPRRLPGSFT